MDRLIEHIERLLFQHDCVIIPDFGGFVLQSVPAVYRGEEHSFTPSRKEIVFNPTLTHNDGLLVESYMQEYSVDYSKAQLFVKKDVSEMKASLDDDSELQFGSIGYFIKEEDRIVFSPDEKSGDLFSTSSYGLPTFSFLPLTARGAVSKAKVSETELPTATKPTKKGTIYIPITRTFIRTVAAAAAAILLFLIFSTPIRDVNRASYTASFIPKEVMPKKTVDDVVSGAFSSSADMSNYVPEPVSPNNAVDSVTESTTTPSVSEKPVVKTENDKTETVAKPESKPETKVETNNTAISKTSTKTSTTASTSTKTSTKKQSNAASSSSNSKKYYIIIGSFETRTQAKNYIRSLKGAEASNSGILVRDGHVRVYAKRFETENSAQSYLDKIRQNSRHKQAWMYKGK